MRPGLVVEADMTVAFKMEWWDMNQIQADEIRLMKYCGPKCTAQFYILNIKFQMSFNQVQSFNFIKKLITST